MDLGLAIMGKWQFCSGVSGRRLFMRNCVLLGAAAVAFGAIPQAVAVPAARKNADKGGFVVINGWVLPAHYFRDTQP